MSGGLIFQVSEQVNIATVWEELSEELAIFETGEETVSSLILDTFDWRLFNAGMMMSLEGRQYSLLSRFGELIWQGGRAVRKAKTFAWDFCDSELEEKLEPVIEVRALLQQFTLNKSFHHYGLLNRDEKTVVRLTYIETAGNHTGQDFALRPVVLVEPLRGYHRESKRVCDMLLSGGLEKCEKGYDIIANVHSELSVDPAATDSTFSVKVERSESVAEVTRDICLHLRATMTLNLPGVLDDLDSEFLHDFRVSVRRTRSLLSLLKKYLPFEEAAYFQKEFKWVGSVTGPVRDLDVYLLQKSEYRAMLPPELHGGLVWFFSGLARQRKRELASLRQHLRSSRFSELMEKWQQFLEALPHRDDTPQAKKRCYKVAEKIIRKRFARIIRDGEQITSTSPDEMLHELRIEGKKFRYTLEFFQSMFYTVHVAVLAKQMKKFQNNLGDFNDFSVQKELLLKKLGNLRGGNARTIETAAALGGLIVHLGDEQRRVRTSFERIFKSFSDMKNIELLESIFTDEGAIFSKGPNKK